jgi:uncharacterized membrane protein
MELVVFLVGSAICSGIFIRRVLKEHRLKRSLQDAWAREGIQLTALQSMALWSNLPFKIEIEEGDSEEVRQAKQELIDDMDTVKGAWFILRIMAIMFATLVLTFITAIVSDMLAPRQRSIQPPPAESVPSHPLRPPRRRPTPPPGIPGT